tara:strand:- start:2241 stop:2498 length:258 start_codon:yes stop_codon:yes gene_type:complete
MNNKYKGFSKLPESVQKKMNPEAAMKYMEGGAVKPQGVHKMPNGSMMRDDDPSMGSYKHGGQVSKSGNCRGGGAAISGTKFTGVK